MKKIIIIILLLILPGSLAIPSLYTQKTKQKTNVYVKNIKFTCEVASSRKEWELGLMFRKTIKTNEGMLFIFPEEQYLSFWMKNTYLPLAIIFIDSNKKVIDVFYPEPLSTKQVTSSKPSKYVLEILSNVSSEINIKPGDEILF